MRERLKKESRKEDGQEEGQEKRKKKDTEGKTIERTEGGDKREIGLEVRQENYRGQVTGGRTRQEMGERTGEEE
jgi:hypothetical protein